MCSAGIAPDAAPHAPAVPGPVLAAGRDADVFALDEERVLRRYRSGRSALGEVRLMAHARSHGFPAPEVFSAQGPDLEMERLHGPTLLQAMAADEVSIADGAAVLADLHTRLHTVPMPEVAGDGSARSGAPLASRLDQCLVHLDLHPANIILTEPHGPALVDWANATIGPAGLDVAMTSVIIAEVAVDAGGAYSRAARALLVAFLALAGVDPRPHLDVAAQRRAHDTTLVPGERELVPLAQELVRHYADIAFDSPASDARA
ncbi:phosphotransferase family protein [Cellulomonas chengniuliangii]|uniref:phosphotransferase family protein n=1 Tax=Cellulomonas chengniuliangii TaxID=2968084 RepID=UPI001D0EE759|nr:phosphotransferase [Cellulomonas chengniuliangii]MCC2316574.1 aminoglycoside phosphotransferase family protein [Cellulomonas chengniuliangii]